MHTQKPVITKGFARPFERTAFLQMIREVVHRDTTQSKVLVVPPTFQRRIVSCQRIGVYRDPIEEPVVFVHVVVRDAETFLRFHSRLYQYVAAHAKVWAGSEVYTCWAIFEQPELQQWRMQVVRGAITHVPVGGRLQKRFEQTGMRAARLESTDQESITRISESLMQLGPTPIAEELCRGVETVSKQPAELVQTASETIRVAIDMQQSRLEHLEQTRPLAARAAINDIQQALNEAAIQWEIATGQLIALLDEQEQLLGEVTVATIRELEGVLAGLADVWEHSKPRRFRFDGSDHQVRDWQQVYQIILQHQYTVHGDAFVTAMNSTKRSDAKPFFALDGSLYKSTRTIGNATPWFYETWLSAQSINANIRKVYEVMGLNPATFQVWIDKKH